MRPPTWSAWSRTAYDANDRLISWGDTSYAYDDKGNLTSDGTHTYDWNERGQLASMRSGATDIASFQYDSSGRRTSKTIGSDTTGFLYDGVNVAQELEGSLALPPA